MTQARIRSWRLKAEELRTVAERMSDPLARRGMLNAAATYEAMANDAERGGEPVQKAVSNAAAVDPESA